MQLRTDKRFLPGRPAASRLFDGLNYVPVFNSFAILHDWFMGSISNGFLRTIARVPSMGPALLVNYECLMYGAPSTVLIEYQAGQSHESCFRAKRWPDVR